MCGITGKVSLIAKDITPNEIMLMDDAIIHRGPDDHGVFISDNHKVGLGNRRLAIIDLSENGHMPMSYKNKYIITYNGEIYNFKEQKKTLKKAGIKFHSETDTEVILALYDKYKTECLKYLRGMFAFAIYDKRENLLFLARDRIGKKPLKYYFDGNTFIFASELKAILTQNEVKRTIDDDAIFDYLTFGYTIPPKTGFTGINKLEPGHYLILDIKNNKVINKCYWQPDYSNKLNLSENEWQRAILYKLKESVRLRMISDVPIGAFLSGGVDSSTVVALMSQISSKPVKTFTIGFSDKNLDESPFADNIVKMYGTDHESIVAKPENIEILPEIAAMYEEPFADASSVITYMVSKMAKNHVTVILNGDGGDENFVGYERFQRVQRDYLFDKYGYFGKSILSFSASTLSKIIKNPTISRLNDFFGKSLLPFPVRYGSYIKYFADSEKANLKYQKLDNVSSLEHIVSLFRGLDNVDPRDKALYWDMTRYLPNDLLTKVDIASMAVSLEARSPFLDHEFIELACKIPFDLKFKNGQFKYILKKSIEGLVPVENIFRRKVGFTIPLDRWFEGSLNKYAGSVLLRKDGYVKKLFGKENLNNMLKKHSVRNDFGPRLWSLLSLELWHKHYFTG